MSIKKLFRSNSEVHEVDGRRLTLPAELEDGRVPNILAKFSYMSSALILALIIWASVAEIREFTVAPGKVVPSGEIKLVHHLEGGQIKRILVSDGEYVEKGAILATLRAETAQSELSQLKVRADHLNVQKIRLAALLKGKEPEFGEYKKSHPKLALEELEVYRNAKDQMKTEKRRLSARISQIRSERSALDGEVLGLAEQVATLKEMFEIRSSLLKKGYASRRSYLETKSEFEKARVQEITALGRRQTLDAKLLEAQSQLEQTQAEALQEFSMQKSKISLELAELKQLLKKHRDRVARLEIRAPVSGIIQNFVPTTVSEVIKAGDLIAEIVPVKDQVVAEIRIEPRDIGHVQVGREVEVTLSTFDPNVFGTVDGKINKLSATTFQTKQGEPFYRGIVELKQGYVSGSGQQYSILPGMIVQANIITGSKSLVRYMLKPVYRSLDSAFSER